MKIKLISCNFGDNSSVVINNQDEINKFNVDVCVYNDSNTASRELSMHSRLKGKIPKMLDWIVSPDYDYYIWVDSKFTLNNGIIETLLTQLGEYDAAFFPHPYRQTIQSELTFMNDLMKHGDSYLTSRYIGEDMDGQVAKYLSDSTFIDNRLFAAGCFIYSKKIIIDKNYNVMKEWFLENSLWSVQDQLSLPYVLHKFGTKYTQFDFNLLNTKLMGYN